MCIPVFIQKQRSHLPWVILLELDDRYQLSLIEKVLNTNPVTYKINDLKGEEIKGSFYEQELQITEF